MMHCPLRILSWPLVVLACVACDDPPPDAARPKPHSSGPKVESIPSPLYSCTSTPRPLVTAIAEARAPVALTVLRANHLCLGEYAAVLRLEGVGPGRVTQLVLGREWWSTGTGRPPRRDVQVVTSTFEKGTVRYLRIRWREGLRNRGERVLRVRIAKAHVAEGPPFQAGPWPDTPPPLGSTGEGLADKLKKVRDGVQDATRKIREAGAKIEAHPLVRHRPEAAQDTPQPEADPDATTPTPRQ